MLSTRDIIIIFMDLVEILQTIGCSESESAIFSAILPYSEGVSVVVLSKKLGFPRPTIYSNLERLIDKGLVKKGLRNEGGIFFAESKEGIFKIYDEKINNLKSARAELTDKLLSSDNLNYKPRFVVYEGLRAYESIFHDILRSKAKETFWIWPLSEMVKRIPQQAFSDFHLERIKEKIWLNVLWPQQKKLSLEKHPLLLTKNEEHSWRRIKLLPKQIDQTMGYGIYGTKVAFLSSERENYAFVVDSKELSMTIKSHFNYLWSISHKHSN